MELYDCKKFHCLGFFVDSETGQINRCDMCRLYASDKDAQIATERLILQVGMFFTNIMPKEREVK